jgi:4'-phosphopantetheinyl transferase
MIKIWYACVTPTNERYEQQVQSQLSISELSRLDGINNNLKRHEYLLSRALMRHAFSCQFERPSSEWQFIERSNLAPLIINLPNNSHFSLSHSHGKICLAISNEPVGIDIEQEKIRPNFSLLANAFMNPEEVQLLNENHESAMETFYKIWCAKEAVYKVTLTTAQNQLFLKQIDYLSLFEGTLEQNLSQGLIEQCHLALITQFKPKNINQLDANTFDGAKKIRWI